MSSYVNPQYLESWRKYQKGLCTDCWAGCCTLPVEAKISDLVRLGLTTPEEADWDLSGLIKRLTKARVIEGYDPREQMFILAQVSGRDCLYLHPTTRTCTVYEKRPDTCRNFPKIGPKSGFCPYKLKTTS